MSDATVQGVEMLDAGDVFAAARGATWVPAAPGAMPVPLPLPKMSPLTLREVVWASAYGAAFAEQFQMAWEAADPGPDRMENTRERVNVARRRFAADAAVERMGER